MNKILLLISFLFALQLLIINSYADIIVNFTVGGPYAKNAQILVSGNVTNTSTNAGLDADVRIDIIKSGRRYHNKNTSSDSSGTFQAIMTPSLDYGSYNVNVTATKNNVEGNSSKDLIIELPTLNTSCQTKNVQINGSVIIADSGVYASSGHITASFLEENVYTAGTFSSGIFSINMTGCLIVGKRYTISLLLEDDTGKRSWNYIIFNAV